MAILASCNVHKKTALGLHLIAKKLVYSVVLMFCLSSFFFEDCILNLNGEMFVNAMEAVLMPTSTVFYFQVVLCLVKHCVQADMTLRQIADIVVR